MLFSSKKTLIAVSTAVGVGTAFLPGITGYGTKLSQIVVLGAYAIIAAITSNNFADQHHGPIWLVALFLNLLLFLIPAFIIWLSMRRRQVSCSITLLGWCAFYLASLFLLFPATDGP